MKRYFEITLHGLESGWLQNIQTLSVVERATKNGSFEFGSTTDALGRCWPEYFRRKPSSLILHKDEFRPPHDNSALSHHMGMEAKVSRSIAEVEIGVEDFAFIHEIMIRMGARRKSRLNFPAQNAGG